MTTKSRILVDLKPALDGYAGIPQESRLLFSNLLNLEDRFDVHGLLQHGTGFYPQINQGVGADKSAAENILPVSDFLSVLSTGVERFYIPRAPLFIQRRITNQHLRVMSYMRTQLQLGSFQTDQFDDLLWRALFSKAVQPQDREKVCQAQFRTLEIPRQLMQNIALSGIRLFPAKDYLKVDTSDYDAMIAQSPFPGRLSANTKLIVRYHDSVPIFMPHTIGDQAIHKAMHYKALKSNVEQGALFSCVSEATRAELIKIFPEVESRSFVLHNVVLDDYFPVEANKAEAWEIVSNYLSAEHGPDLSSALSEIKDAQADGVEYVLMVSTLEPRKNHEALISAFYEYRARAQKDVRLILVGSRGWHCDPIVSKVAAGIARGLIFHLTGVPATGLRTLYAGAAATVCPSFSEGFDYSGVEAMRCGGYVLASEIPVHREVLDVAADYFDQYSPGSLAAALERALDPAQHDHVNSRRAKAIDIAERYRAPYLREKWRGKLEEILAN